MTCTHVGFSLQASADMFVLVCSWNAYWCPEWVAWRPWPTNVEAMAKTEFYWAEFAFLCCRKTGKQNEQIESKAVNFGGECTFSLNPDCRVDRVVGEAEVCQGGRGWVEEGDEHDAGEEQSRPRGAGQDHAEEQEQHQPQALGARGQWLASFLIHDSH